MEYYTDNKFLDLQQIFPWWEWWTIEGGYYIEDDAVPVISLRPKFPLYSPRFMRNMIVENPKEFPIDLSPISEDPPFIAAVGENIQKNNYQPLDNPKLFLEFASVGNDMEGALSFASRYGNLTTFMIQRYSDGQPRYADSLPAWLHEHEELCWTARLWELQRQEGKVQPDIDALRKIINWKANGSWEYILTHEYKHKHYASAQTLISAAKRGCCFRDGFIYGKFEPVRHSVDSILQNGDVLIPARIALSTIVNAKLTQHGLETMITLDPEDPENRLAPYQMPNNLIGAMWLQLLLAAIGEKQFKRCKICGYWEDTTERRSDWHFHESCANKQRQKRHYYEVKDRQRGQKK